MASRNPLNLTSVSSTAGDINAISYTKSDYAVIMHCFIEWSLPVLLGMAYFI